jgi:RNA polymerase sigma-70 factor (ECF subfamily)
MAGRYGLQSADADDLTQRVFISVARKVSEWEPRSSDTRFRNWLGRIARNAILNELARAKPDRAVGAGAHDDVLVEIPDRSDLESTIEIEARRQALRFAISSIEGEFSPLSREMFRQTAIEGIPPQVVANTLGKSVGAVYIARCRIMQRIKERIEEMSDFWSPEE